MNVKRSLVSQLSLIAILAVLFLANNFFAQSNSDKFAQVDKLFEKWNKPDSPGCALAIIKDGEIIYKQSYGMANLDHNIPIKSNTVFRIGSISKQFTAACILILHQKGNLSLDDDIRKYIPEMPEYEWPVTIRHLIHHTSGIREYEVLQTLGGELTDQAHHTNDDLLEMIAQQNGLDFRPGDKYQYSNSGYTLLSIIVERVSRKMLRQFAKEHIFDPLGMKHTIIYDDNTAIVKNRATGYSLINSGLRVNETLNESTGDGGVFTTVEDFFLWDQNFYHNKIDCPDFVNNMLQAGKLNDGTDIWEISDRRKEKYAFGLMLSTYKGIKVVGHGGAYIGFRAGYIQFPDQRLSIICLANLANINPMQLCYQIADIFLEDHFQEEVREKKEIKPESEKHKKSTPKFIPKQIIEYVGDYYNDEIQATYKLRSKNGELFFIQKNAPTNKPLKSEDKDIFSYWFLKLRFNRNKEGKITGFTIISSYLNKMTFKKISTNENPRQLQ